LADFKLDGDYIRMRAVDDLAGCGAVLAAVERLVHDSAEADVYAVFTRAEEGGLFGARLLAEAGTLPGETLVVSIESSPVIPGVAQGDGPVIRTGDRLYTFDADAEQVLIVAREAIRKRDPAFKSQRQLMSGGVCEGTAFAVFGYRATGMAFPLGNYHNATTSIPDEGGGVDAEYIRLSDYLGGVELLTEAARSVGKRGDSPARRRMRQVPEEVRARLETTSAW
jgi:endoglucanase